MRKILIGMLLLGICSICYAELYVIVDSQTDEIYSVSENNDTVLPQGKELKVLPGGWENYEFDENPIDYKFKNNKFIKNISKIDNREKAKKAKIEKELELKVIEERMKKLAIDQLKAEGLSFDHY